MQALKEADGDIPITVKLDDSQFKELSNKDQNIDVTVNDSALDNLKSKLDSLDETKDVTVNVTATGDIDKIQQLGSSIKKVLVLIRVLNILIVLMPQMALNLVG